MAVTEKTYTPKVLAAEIGIDAKVLRAYLRKNHARTADRKNTSWIITEKVAVAAREYFKKNRAGSAAETKKAPAKPRTRKVAVKA